jgi:hypothetical protein
MTPQPTQVASAERRQPMWPWLLIPLVTLTVFFVLSKLKEAAAPSPTSSLHHPEAPADTRPAP